MKLIFKKIQLHDFMSFRDEVFDFDKTSGMVLIRGKNNDVPNETNGAGKSTIGYSLLYALFGQLQNKIKNENIINRSSSDRDMRLVLDFSSDDVDYRIERGISKGRNSYFNLFKITDNETEITKSTIQETQKFLETEILKCDISIFLRTIMLTADQTYNFYMLKKQDKKDFVEKLFDIGVFGDMYSDIHKDVLQLDRTALAKQNQLMILNQNASDYAKRSDQFETKHAENMKILEKRLSAAEASYAEINGKEVKLNESAVEKLTDALQKLQNAELECSKTDLDIDGKIQRIGLKIKEFDMKRQQNQKQINSHSDLMHRLCPDCAKTFSEYYNLDDCQREIDKVAASKKILTEKKTEIQEKRTANQKKRDEISAKINLAKSKIRDLTSESSAVKTRLISAEREVESIKAAIASEKNAVNPYKDMIDKNADDIKRESSETEDLIKKISYLKFAESIVSQDTLRKFIIRDLIGILNNRIRKYLISLGANYYVQFDDDMDYEFVPTVGTCEFGNFSAGERMRLMIATSFAFRDFMSIRNGLNANILILDEYFDGAISSVCIENLMSILKEYRSEYSQNIFIISQRPEVQLDSFDKVVQVEKTDDISRITYL